MSRRSPVVTLVLACGFAAAATPNAEAQFMTGRRVDQERNAQAQAISARELVEQVSYAPPPGAQLPLEAGFLDESGKPVRLGDYFGERPVVVALVYYRCPMLCTLIERALARGLKPLDFEPGREMEIVFVSFDPADTPAAAAERKAEIVEAYGRPESAASWHFLSADPAGVEGGAAAISALTGALGFRSVRSGGGDFAHASGVVVTTADGRVARFLPGADYAPRDLKLALVEAGEGKIGGAIEQAMLICFRYDEALGKYTAATMTILKIGATLTILAVGGFVLLSLRRERLARPPRQLPAGGAVS